MSISGFAVALLGVASSVGSGIERRCSGSTAGVVFPAEPSPGPQWVLPSLPLATSSSSSVGTVNYTCRVSN